MRSLCHWMSKAFLTRPTSCEPAFLIGRIIFLPEP
nr:MAG TPA_asm: hypothetical protein [Caudoviricetes sp.]